ncbi:MAG: hypothetical protein WA825_06785 [Steroidobacteraceae bacterium]
MSIGRVDTTNAGLAAQHTRSTTASLQGRIRVAREQLNDWVTCVSATTPKGQAEIRSLSAQISAAQEQIQRLSQSSGPTAASDGTNSRLDIWV